MYGFRKLAKYASPGGSNERVWGLRNVHSDGFVSYVDPVRRNGCAPMQQIADWLGKLGLGQYAQRFAENDINFTILSDLSDQDLKELGVSSLGHRRQLLRAIAELDIFRVDGIGGFLAVLDL